MSLTYRTPAKLNLGLEVVGRRPDGYHELVTIFQAAGVYDTLRLAPAPELTLHAPDNLGGEDNLVSRAARALSQYAGAAPGAALTLTKTIPVAAGLGGGSSDAAATLLGLNRLWALGLSVEVLAALGASLGADVPFFVRGGGTALATGIGEQLTALPALEGGWFVILTPPVSLPPVKTQALYAALTADDFSDGSRTRAQAERLRQGQPLDSALLVNGFAAPLLRLCPALAGWQARFLDAGAPWALPSGSGPTLYTLAASAAAAGIIAGRLAGSGAAVYVAPAVAGPQVVCGMQRG